MAYLGSFSQTSAEAVRRPADVTPWFAAHIAPVRSGWYEVASVGWNADRFYWSGHDWFAWKPQFMGDGKVFFGLYSGDKWRGLRKSAAASPSKNTRSGKRKDVLT